MGHGKQSKKKVVKYLKDWNGSRYLDQEEFCRISFKVNKNKVMIFASLVSDYVFARYVEELEERTKYLPHGLGMSREKRGKIGHMLHEAKYAMEQIRDASSNEELFHAQYRLRDICSAFVDAGIQVLEGNREAEQGG